LDRVAGIAGISDGDIIVSGGAMTLSEFDDGEIPDTIGDAIFASARLKKDGQLDQAYGDAGIARAGYSNGEALRHGVEEFGLSGVLPGAFALTSDGSALLAANSDTLAVAEFTSDG